MNLVKARAVLTRLMGQLEQEDDHGTAGEVAFLLERKFTYDADFVEAVTIMLKRERPGLLPECYDE